MKHSISKIVKNDLENNLNEFIEDLNSLTDTLCYLTDSLSDGKVKLEIWKKYFEILLVKFSFHSFSLVHLLKGTPIQFKKKSVLYPDLGSILVLNRAMIECFVTFYYLNIEPENDAVGEFRQLRYQIEGLNNRQSYETGSKNLSQKKEDEKKLIEELKLKLSSNLYFQQLSIKEQKELLNDKAQKIGWLKLIENSPLKDGHFKTIWKVFSNSAHSEYIGSIQLIEYLNKPLERNELLMLSAKLASIMNCLLIKHLKDKYKTAEIVYNTLPLDTINLIEDWIVLGSKK